MIRLGVLASHQGTNFQAIVDACKAHKLDGSVELLISNNSHSMAMQRAAIEGIKSLHLSSATHPDDHMRDLAICNALQAANVDLVVLAGYMKKLGPHTLQAFTDKLINVHPSLLPRHGGEGMFGLRVHETVLATGDAETGATVHQVVGEYDTGAIVLQKRVPVLKEDTAEILSRRVLALEHEVLIEAINFLVCESHLCQSESL